MCAPVAVSYTKNIPCIDEDMSNPDEALDILWQLICKDGMESHDASIQSPSE